MCVCAADQMLQKGERRDNESHLNLANVAGNNGSKTKTTKNSKRRHQFVLLYVGCSTQNVSTVSRCTRGARNGTTLLPDTHRRPYVCVCVCMLAFRIAFADTQSCNLRAWFPRWLEYEMQSIGPDSATWMHATWSRRRWWRSVAALMSMHLQTTTTTTMRTPTATLTSKLYIYMWGVLMYSGVCVSVYYHNWRAY